jgi:PEP-CTERM motif-containing protein
VTGTGSDTLTFSFFNPGNFFFLDDVGVNPTASVPEPSSIALLFGGLVGLDWVLRRRRRSVV